MRIKLGENIFNAIASIYTKNIGKALKSYLNLKQNKTILDLFKPENIEILTKLQKVYPHMTCSHVKRSF